MCRTRRFVASTTGVGRSVVFLRNTRFLEVLERRLGIGALGNWRAANFGWNGREDLDWFLYTFDEGMISVLSVSALLTRVSASGEQTEEDGMPMKRLEYDKNFASRGM